MQVDHHGNVRHQSGIWFVVCVDISRDYVQSPHKGRQWSNYGCHNYCHNSHWQCHVHPRVCKHGVKGTDKGISVSASCKHDHDISIPCKWQVPMYVLYIEIYNDICKLKIRHFVYIKQSWWKELKWGPTRYWAMAYKGLQILKLISGLIHMIYFGTSTTRLTCSPRNNFSEKTVWGS